MSGFRDDLVTALVWTLPKVLRRTLTPLADTARLAAQRVMPNEAGLAESLAEVLSELGGERVSASDFDLDRVPPHLRITFSVEADDGRLLALGKDLDALRKQLSGRVRQSIAQSAPGLERSGIVSWDFGTLAQVVETVRDGHAVRGYPALLDDGESVSIRIFTNQEIQQRVMRAGLRRLLLLTVPLSRKSIGRDISNEALLAIGRAGSVKLGGLADDCITAAADRVLGNHGDPVWDEAAFVALQHEARADLAAIATAAMSMVGQIYVAAATVEASLGRLVTPALAPAVADMRKQLARLLRPGFVTGSGTARLVDVVRYIRAIERRVDKLPSEPGRDRQRMLEIVALERRYAQFIGTLEPSQITAEVIDVGWMIEELRVGEFAQTLGTKQSVSAKRIGRVIDQLEAP